MNRFTADFSSSTAETPNPPSRGRNVFAAPNATPDLASTTPLAPPPSQPFGSSRFGSGVSKLRFAQNQSPPSSHLTANEPRRNNNFQFSTNSENQHEQYEDEEYDVGMEEDGWEEDEDSRLPPNQPWGQSINKPAAMSKSLLRFSTASQLQPGLVNQKQMIRPTQYSALPSKGDEQAIPNLARDYLKHTRPATLDNDPDAAILESEPILRLLQEDAEGVQSTEDLDMALADAARTLEKTWAGSIPVDRRGPTGDLSIGPGHDATPYENAVFVAKLILQLYNSSAVPQDDANLASPSEILLNWLNQNHTGSDFVIDQVVETEGNPTSSEYFWDAVEVLVARGHFAQAMHFLQEADFSYSLIEDGSNFRDANFSGAQLQTIETAVYRLRQALNSCPAVASGNWHLNSPEWDTFRTELESAVEELGELAGHDDQEDQYLPFGARNLPSSALPHFIYEHLKAVYSIMLGSAVPITALSNDWLEASLLLTIWYSGSAQNDVAQWSFDVSRAHRPDEDSRLELATYLTRLKASFLAVTDPQQRDAFRLNPQSPLELALGLVLQGDMAAALSIIQTFSLCITSSLAEVGSWTGWLVTLPSMNKEDLMVLTNGANDRPLAKDDVLELYAQALFERPFLSVPNSDIEGWELAFAVVSRFDDPALTKATVATFLDEMKIDENDRASRLVTLCGELGLHEEGRRVSETYGDTLVSTSRDYGTALLCYARSHAEGKVRQVIDLLNSYCLVQSTAYPSEEDIDAALSRLVSDPKAALAGIAEADPTAVETLQFSLVGYACLRRFYNIRDNTTNSTQSLAARKKQAARALIAAINSASDSIYGGLYDPERQTALQVDTLLPLLGEATALFSQTSSPADRTFSTKQLYALLTAVEHLSTSPVLVQSATEECLSAALRDYSGQARPPSPHAMLKKSVSSGTASTFSFSMMGSEMLASADSLRTGMSDGSAVLVGGAKGKRPGSAASGAFGRDTSNRGWDWRSRFVGGGTEPGIAEVLKHLRISIAKELSLAELEAS